MIVEAVGGGWGKEARCVWSELAQLSVTAAGEFASDSVCGAALAQRLSMTLHRESARAILRRSCVGEAHPSPERLDSMAEMSVDA